MAIHHFLIMRGAIMAHKQTPTTPRRGHDADTEVETRDPLDEQTEEIREDAEQRFAERGDPNDDIAPDDED
jgi:hypothetical protein